MLDVYEIFGQRFKSKTKVCVFESFDYRKQFES